MVGNTMRRVRGRRGRGRRGRGRGRGRDRGRVRGRVGLEVGRHGSVERTAPEITLDSIDSERGQSTYYTACPSKCLELMWRLSIKYIRLSSPYMGNRL